MDMKKLLGLTLACALLLTGCGARGGDKGEKLGDNTIRPLELTGEEAALLKLVGAPTRSTACLSARPARV